MQAVAPDVVPYQLGTFLHRGARMIVTPLHARLRHLADMGPTLGMSVSER